MITHLQRLSQQMTTLYGQMKEMAKLPKQQMESAFANAVEQNEELVNEFKTLKGMALGMLRNIETASKKRKCLPQSREHVLLFARVGDADKGRHKRTHTHTHTAEWLMRVPRSSRQPDTNPGGGAGIA
jgi:hypothetical protein